MANEVNPVGAPSPRVMLGYDGTDYYALTLDAAGHLQIDVVSSALPAGIATEAKQDTMITALQLIDDLRNALDSVGTDELDVNVEASVLPAGAATATKQDTMITALQLIDDLRGALVSVDEDTLKVTGEDQLFSFGEQWMESDEDLSAVAGENVLNSSETPAGTVRILTSVNAVNNDSACTYLHLCIYDGASRHSLKVKVPSAAYDGVCWQGFVPLAENDKVQAVFGGCTLNDDIFLSVHGFDMGVMGYVPGEWEIDGASYEAKSCDISSEMPTAYALFFKSDGTRFYVTGSAHNRLHSYALSTAWDVSTCSYLRQAPTLSGTDNSPTGLFFKPDGTKVYWTGGSDDVVQQFSLSTPWNIGSASLDASEYDVSTEDTAPQDIFFKPDGSKFYIIGNQNDTIYQYTAGGLWDVNASTYDTKSLDVSSEDTSPTGLWFNPDGDKLYVTGTQNDMIYQYELTTPWDISTASYTGDSFDVSSEDTNPHESYIRSDGLKLYIVGNQNDRVYQYSLAI